MSVRICAVSLVTAPNWPDCIMCRSESVQSVSPLLRIGPIASCVGSNLCSESRLCSQLARLHHVSVRICAVISATAPNWPDCILCRFESVQSVSPLLPIGPIGCGLARVIKSFSARHCCYLVCCGVGCVVCCDVGSVVCYGVGCVMCFACCVFCAPLCHKMHFNK